MLKQLVDVLSLSATPIPRSLRYVHDRLRDLSVIDTPPPERYPIKTYVLNITEHHSRGYSYRDREKGQVFVHNRIQDIYAVRERLQERCPASIGWDTGVCRKELSGNLDFWPISHISLHHHNRIRLGYA